MTPTVFDLWRDATRAYRQSFGNVRGAQIYRVLKRGTGEVSVRLPGHSAPLWVRRGTSDVLVFEQVFVEGEYDFPLVSAPSAVLDGGANVGFAAVHFARRWPSAQVVAVEPDSQNFEMLLRNVSSYPSVTSVQAALWDRPARLRFENPDAEPWEFRVEEGEGDIEAITVEAAAQASGLDGFDLVKLDIEGAEVEVLGASASWLGQVQTVVIEPHEYYRVGCDVALEAALPADQFEKTMLGENVVARRRLR